MTRPLTNDDINKKIFLLNSSDSSHARRINRIHWKKDIKTLNFFHLLIMIFCFSKKKMISIFMYFWIVRWNENPDLIRCDSMNKLISRVVVSPLNVRRKFNISLQLHFNEKKIQATNNCSILHKTHRFSMMVSQKHKCWAFFSFSFLQLMVKLFFSCSRLTHITHTLHSSSASCCNYGIVTMSMNYVADVIASSFVSVARSVV